MSDETFGKLQERYNSNPRSLVFARLAEQTFQKGNREQALTMLERGISLNPSYITGYAVLARLLRLSGHNEKALSVWHKLLSIDPYNIDAMLQLAELSFEQKKIKLALAYLFQVLTIDPINSTAMELLALHSEEIIQTAPELFREQSEKAKTPLEKVGTASFSLIGVETKEQPNPLPVVKTLKDDVIPAIAESMGLKLEEPESVTMDEFEPEAIELFPEIEQIFGKFEVKDTTKTEEATTASTIAQKEKPTKPEIVTETPKSTQMEMPSAIEVPLLPESAEENGGILDMGLSEEILKETDSVITSKVQRLPKIQQSIESESSEWKFEFPQEKYQTPSVPEQKEEKKLIQEVLQDTPQEPQKVELLTQLPVEEKEDKAKQEEEMLATPLSEDVLEGAKSALEISQEKPIFETPANEIPEIRTEEQLPMESVETETGRKQQEDTIIIKQKTDVTDELSIPQDILDLLSGPVFDVESTDEEQSKPHEEPTSIPTPQSPEMTLKAEIETIEGFEQRGKNISGAPEQAEILDGISTRTEFTPPSDVEQIEGLIKRPDEPLGAIADEDVESLIDKLQSIPPGSDVSEKEEVGEETGEQTSVGKNYYTSTMAEICAAQGLTEKAIEIYEALLCSHELSLEERERFQERVNMLRKRILK